MLLSHYLDEYRAAIEALPNSDKLSKDDLLTDAFLMKKEGRLSMYYAPHNEYINPEARVMIIGLTPGLQQMKKAIVIAKQAMQQGLEDEEVCKLAKNEASFAGSMRQNLIHMLQELQLQRYLGIATCEALFHEHRNLLHTVSMLKFPVMIDHRNYSGSQPSVNKTPFLKEAALSFLQEELKVVGKVLIIPLGKAVESILQCLVEDGKLEVECCLWGFPHPSGANAHRFQQFADRKESMMEQLHAFYSSKIMNG